MMQVTASWREGASFEVVTESGHSLIVDGPPDHGGVNAGARPMELMLAAAATCSAFDVVSILRKGRHEFNSVRVEANGERADTVPAVFTDINLKFIVAGVKDVPARRAVQLSVEKYCSALRMLEQSAKIGWSLETKGIS